MKKTALVLASILTIISCSKDETSIDQSLNLSKELSVDTQEVEENSNKSNNDIFVGSIATKDLSIHSKISISESKDGSLKAVLFSSNNEKVVLETSNQFKSDLNNVLFTNSTSSFKLDMSNENQPIVSEVSINNQVANMVLFNNKNNNIVVLLGSYVDENDSNFFGAFDVFSDSTPHPVYPSVGFNITATSFTTPGGSMFIDSTFENFDFSHCGQSSNFIPVMRELRNGEDAYFFAGNQTLPIDGINDITYDIIKTKGLSRGYRTSECTKTTHGTWSWKERTGFVSFNFITNPE